MGVFSAIYTVSVQSGCKTALLVPRPKIKKKKSKKIKCMKLVSAEATSYNSAAWMNHKVDLSSKYLNNNEILVDLASC